MLRRLLSRWLTPEPIRFVPVVIPDGVAVALVYPGHLNEAQRAAVKAHLEGWAKPRGISPIVLEGGLQVQLAPEQREGSDDRA